LGCDSFPGARAPGPPRRGLGFVCGYAPWALAPHVAGWGSLCGYAPWALAPHVAGWGSLCGYAPWALAPHVAGWGSLCGYAPWAPDPHGGLLFAGMLVLLRKSMAGPQLKRPEALCQPAC